MTKGRKVGQTEINIDTIITIQELTEKGMTRPEIAKAVGRSEMTIYNYQKKFGII